MADGTHVEDDAAVCRLLLDGLASSRDLDDVHAELAALHQRRSTSPARPLLELAADAFALTGSTREHPLDLAGLTRAYIPDWVPRGNTAQQKHRYALTAAVLIAAGTEPEPEDVGWWRNDDLWHHAFVTAVIYIRAAGYSQHVDVAATCSMLR